MELVHGGVGSDRGRTSSGSHNRIVRLGLEGRWQGGTIETRS
jgi:hypothetical protein